MSDDFPYTPDEVGQFHRAHHQMPGFVDPTSTRRGLQRLHDAGVTVTFPEPPAPRFQSHPWNGYEEYVVVDHGDPAEPIVASFDAHWHPSARNFAENHAASLNKIEDALEADQ